MRLTDHMSRSGASLFRWRSYLPLALVPLLVDAAFRGKQIEAALGAFWGGAFAVLAVGLVVAGQGLRMATVGHVPRGTSGRNVQGQRAEALNTTGIYSVVRNPLYLANCLMYLGVALFSQSLIAALVMALVLLPYYERIIAAEEQFLTVKFGAEYDDWTARTPAFLPRLKGWVPSALPFSWRSVIRRERASVFGAVVALYLMELGLNLLGPVPAPMPGIWHWVLLLAVVLEVAAILVKRHTDLLAVEGR